MLPEKKFREHIVVALSVRFSISPFLRFSVRPKQMVSGCYLLNDTSDLNQTWMDDAPWEEEDPY